MADPHIQSPMDFLDHLNFDIGDERSTDPRAPIS